MGPKGRCKDGPVKCRPRHGLLVILPFQFRSSKWDSKLHNLQKNRGRRFMVEVAHGFERKRNPANMKVCDLLPLT